MGKFIVIFNIKSYIMVIGKVLFVFNKVFKFVIIIFYKENFRMKWFY